jgi:type I restriction enzyme, S subunit
MAGEWTSTTLEDVCTTITDGAHLSPREDPRGLPMASVKDLTRHGIELGDCKRISATDFAKLKRQGCMPEWGDVLIAKDGNSALDTVCVHRLREEVVLLSSVAILRPNARVDSDFLHYYLDAPQIRAFLKAGFRSGSAIPRVVLKDFRRAPVTLPPLNQQRAIAHILGTLDDKIELNRRMNETLEAMARALFKSWFVDFDPVRARAECRDPGLPKPLADLFPNRMEITAFYTAPGGWRVLHWGELVTLEYGKSLEGYAGEEKPVPVYGTNGRIGSCAKPLCENAGIIIGRKGAYRGVHWCSEPFFVIDTAFFVAAKSPIELRWAYYELLRRDINSMDSGSAIPSTSRADFYGLEVLTPPLEFQQAFVRLLTPCWARQEQNAAESRTLAALRDTLLPKMISGELRIPVAEKLVDGAI